MFSSSKMTKTDFSQNPDFREKRVFRPPGQKRNRPQNFFFPCMRCVLIIKIKLKIKIKIKLKIKVTKKIKFTQKNQKIFNKKTRKINTENERKNG